ncbi:hypothetical protein LXL04_020145 [Taraxacum kok-saghyz]
MGIGGFHKQQRRKMVKSEATENGEERSWWWIVGKRRRQWTGRQLIGRLNHGENRRQKKNVDVINNKAMIGTLQWERSSWSLGSNSDRSRGKCLTSIWDRIWFMIPVFQVLAVLLPSRDRAARDAVWCLSAAVAAYVGLVNHIIYKDHFLEKVDFFRFKMLIANWDCFCKWFFKWALQNSDAVRALKAADFFRIQMLLGLMWDW